MNFTLPYQIFFKGISAIVFFFICIILAVGCRKDPVDITNEQSLTEDYLFSPTTSNFVRGGSSLSKEDTTAALTILGNSRVNPYTISNFRAAFSAIFPNSSYVLPVTHRYIKFTPATIEQVKELFSSEFNMYDYPLDREVIEMGDYYLPPGASITAMPILYAVIPLDKTIPNISYQILSELHLNSPNEMIIRQALTQAGYDPDVEGYTLYSGGNGTTTTTTDHCQCTEYIQGNAVNTFIIDSQGEACNYFDEFHGPGYSIECNSFSYPPIDNGLMTNNCGCQVYRDQSKPGGCLRVNDTNFGWEGVRRAKVILKDNWFTEDEVWSDDGGCFRVNKKYKGVAWMWVKFTSPRITIRGVRREFGAAFQWMVPVKDYVGRVYNVFNSISVDYDTWTLAGSSAHLYWGAATVNNSLHEFYDYASTDGINPPPSNLDMFVGWNRNDGFALMESQHILAGPIGVAAAALGSLVSGPFAALIGVVGWAGVLAYLPEVQIGINYRTSHTLKVLAYHELAHASHFTKAGPFVWDALASSTILAWGHGNANSSGAPLISLAESWAEFIGLTYNDRTYASALFGNFYLDLLEDTRNETENHIPVGIYHDLIDVGGLPFQTACDSDQRDRCPPVGGGVCCGSIHDQIDGFTIAQMFNLLDPLTLSPTNFKDRLIQGASFSVQTKVNDLFNSY